MKLLIVLLISLYNFSAQSSDLYQDLFNGIMPIEDLPNAELKLLRRDLKIQSILIDSINEIQISGGEIKNIDKATNNIHRSIGLALEARTVNVEERVKNEVKEIFKTTIKPTRLKDQIIRAMKTIKSGISARGVTMSSLTRRFGIQVGLFYFAMAQLDFTIPIVLMLNGQVSLGGKLLATPISSTTTVIFAAAKSAIRYRHLMKKLGMKGTKKLFDTFKKVKNSVDRSIFATNYPIDMTVAGKQFKINVQETKFLSRLFQRLGYKKYLDYNSLLTFLNDNDLFRGFTRRISYSKAPAFTKSLLILDKIQRSGEKEIILKLRKKFGRKVIMTKGIPTLDHQVAWALKFSYAKNVTEVFSLLGKMPKDLAPRSFNKLWKEMIFPSISVSFGHHTSIDHFKAFKNLDINYDKNLWANYASSNDYEFSDRQKRMLSKFFYESFSPLNSCAQVYNMKKGATAPLL